MFATAKIKLHSVEERTSKTGISYCTGYGFTGSNDESFGLSLVAFTDTAKALAKMSKGDTVIAVGTVKMNRYEAKDGSTKESLQMVIDTLATAKRASAVVNKRPEFEKREPTPAAKQAAHDFQDSALPDFF